MFPVKFSNLLSVKPQEFLLDVRREEGEEKRRKGEERRRPRNEAINGEAKDTWCDAEVFKPSSWRPRDMQGVYIRRRRLHPCVFFSVALRWTNATDRGHYV